MHGLRRVAALALLVASFGTHAMGRLADVTVTDRTTGRVLPVYWHEGKPWIAGAPGHEYSVAVRNRSGDDLLAVVSVDGVNVMSGETASPSQGGYVVRPHGRVEIKGWRKSLDDVASFYFTSLADSYAARTDRPDDVGVIGVALFQRARPLPPPAEVAPAQRDPDMQRERAQRNESRKSYDAPAPAAPAAPGARGEPLATGHGRREESPVRYVDFERATAQPAETLVIRYDSYANLVAMGVIPTYGRRGAPRPFPGAFAPDP